MPPESEACYQPADLFIYFPYLCTDSKGCFFKLDLKFQRWCEIINPESLVLTRGACFSVGLPPDCLVSLWGLRSQAHECTRNPKLQIRSSHLNLISLLFSTPWKFSEFLSILKDRRQTFACVWTIVRVTAGLRALEERRLRSLPFVSLDCGVLKVKGRISSRLSSQRCCLRLDHREKSAGWNTPLYTSVTHKRVQSIYQILLRFHFFSKISLGLPSSFHPC